MSSSTSSSKGNSVWTGMLLGLAIFAVYEVAIRAGLVKAGEGASQAQSNVIHLERVAHPKGQPSVVLVGSSLTMNLPSELIDHKALNLGLGAGTPVTGLEAVVRSKVRPKVVLVEMNQPIIKEYDAEAVDQLFNPVTYWSTGTVHAFQQNYQLFNVFSTVMRRRLYGGTRRVERNVSSKVREQAITRAVQIFDTPPSAQEQKSLKTNIDMLARQVDELESCGVKVVLMSIPGEPSVQATPRVRSIMSALESRFPKSKYTWLPEKSDVAWATQDGIHIVPQQAEQYAKYVGEELRKMNLLSAER